MASSQALNTNKWLDRVNELLREIIPANRFYRARLGAGVFCHTEGDFFRLPFTTKRDLVDDAGRHPPFGTNLTYPLETYTRFHQTSGTTGAPLRVLDTAATWDWWGRCWMDVLRAAGVEARDRLFFAFSFAPSIGFWAAHHGAAMLGSLSIPGGGATSAQRLRLMLDAQATVLLSTPSYALHLAEVARREGVRLQESGIRVTVHAGEPGASLPATRAALAAEWNATPIDHAGGTEVGAYGLGCRLGNGIHVNQDEFVAEIVDPQTLAPVAGGERGELVITSLGRGAWPVIRYRTGDVVAALRAGLAACACGSRLPLLEGGILGRIDDMITVRGVNVFPSALENVIRATAGLAEYRVTVLREHALDELSIELEARHSICEQVAKAIREQVGIRVEVQEASTGSLPRWEAKAKRVEDRRGGKSDA